MIKRDAKELWVESDTFTNGVNLKTPFPKVGDTVCGKLILKAWISENGVLKAYRTECGTCGSVTEYQTPSSLKNGTSSKCKYCTMQSDSTIHFLMQYGNEDGYKLIRLYAKRYYENYEYCKSKHFDSGTPFYDSWRDDYKGFATYIVSLPGFEDWPKLQLDRIDYLKAYEPGNLRFVTRSVNQTNRSNVRKIEVNGITYNRPDFIRILTGGFLDIKLRDFIFARIDIRKYSVEQTLRELYKYKNSFRLEIRTAIQQWLENSIILEDKL